MMYLVALGYLFLGVAISADTFMASIEVITSKTRTEVIAGQEVEVEIWNGTVANLTLMALGSSAPEILLAVIETCGTLGEKAGELGPSTIVGSASFNLMVITAICIPSVDEPKAVEDVGVFMTTSFFSIFAYCWLYVCLAVWTPNEVTITEAWLTLSFFLILIVLAFGADRFNAFKKQRNMSLEEKENEKIEKEKNIQKT
jgi:solute carrier family 8 (sodium/calcium exchanger)